MTKLKETLNKSKQLIEFVDEQGWSEEELAKVINLLHSELKDTYLSLSSSDTVL